MKNFIKYTLQKLFGLSNYLFLFAQFVILKLPFSKHERDFLRFLSLIDDGDHVIDIGANIGVMTYFFSKKLPQSGVHSFEPVKENMEVLRKVKKKYGLLNVKIYPYALGDENKIIQMIMPKSNKAYLHGLSHVKTDNSKEEGKYYSIEARRLDDVEEINKLKIRAIKIDVEEYEFYVLSGAIETIKKNRPIIYCELWDSGNRIKSIDLIKSLNYRIFINKDKTLTEYKNQKYSQNFFFIPVEYCEGLKLY